MMHIRSQLRMTFSECEYLMLQNEIKKTVENSL